MKISIRLLTERDDRRAFRSGDVELDRFFQQYAGQNQFRHHIGSTYIAVRETSNLIAGFATVAPAHVDDIPPGLRKNVAKYPLPVLRLARLAVSDDLRGEGIGEALLRFVFDLASRLADDYGCVGVLVDAKANAESFYARYGFYRIEISHGESGGRPRSVPMFLPIGAIRSSRKPGDRS
jgi:GNAT superfamily N-acetyltransferase